MATPPTPSIREVLLAIVSEMAATLRPDGNLQQSSVLREAARRLGAGHGDSEIEQAILTQWQELFRTGLLAWGLNLSNPDAPFFHLTDIGRRALANATRDPSNPAGYMRHLTSRANIGSIATSYLAEGLDCYVAGHFKAAAVMVGAAAECIILELRDLVVAKLDELGKTVPRDLKGWQIRSVTTALTTVFDGAINTRTHRELRERYDMYWSAFTGQLRTVRNEAGHPTSIDPVTPDTVHASLLVFPELASLASALWTWVMDDMQ